MDQYHPLPQPDEIPIREKEDAMGAYFMMFASVAAGLPLPVVNLIAAIIYYYLNKSKSLFVRFHSLQSLLSQLPTTVINWGVVYIIIRLIFFDDAWTPVYKGYVIMAAVANLLYFIFSIVAAVKARKGKFYYFLFFGPLCYHSVFRKKETVEKEGHVNKPPRV